MCQGCVLHACVTDGVERLVTGSGVLGPSLVVSGKVCVTRSNSHKPSMAASGGEDISAHLHLQG